MPLATDRHCSCSMHERVLRDFHDDQHPRAFAFCGEDPCRSWRQHRDEAHEERIVLGPLETAYLDLADEADRIADEYAKLANTTGEGVWRAQAKTYEKSAERASRRGL